MEFEASNFRLPSSFLFFSSLFLFSKIASLVLHKPVLVKKQQHRQNVGLSCLQIIFERNRGFRLAPTTGHWWYPQAQLGPGPRKIMFPTFAAYKFLFARQRQQNRCGKMSYVYGAYIFLLFQKSLVLSYPVYGLMDVIIVWKMSGHGRGWIPRK